MVVQYERIKINRLPSSQMLNKIIMNYFIKAKIAKAIPWKHLAWGTAGFPMELFWTYDLYALHPENAACVSAVRGLSQEMIEYAESLGFSRDLCSYFKTNVGSIDKKMSIFKGGVDKPLIACSTNTICDTHVKWFQIQARRLGVPYFGFDIPVHVSGLNDDRVDEFADYIVEQLYDFFDVMKKLTGKDFPEKKFWEILKKSDRLCELWQEIYEYRKLIPTQFVFQDTLAAIFPMVILPGLDVGIKFYEALLRDIKQRVKEGGASLPPGKEKYRVLFEGIPFWYKIKYLYELSNYGVAVVYEPYTYSFGPRKRLGLPLKETFRELAKLIMDTPYNYNLEKRIEYFEKVIDEYKIDGVILHSNMSCRPSATNMIDLKNAIQRDKGIPVMILNCDMNDPRAYAEEQIKTRTEAFIELMDRNKYGD